MERPVEVVPMLWALQVLAIAFELRMIERSHLAKHLANSEGRSRPKQQRGFVAELCCLGLVHIFSEEKADQVLAPYRVALYPALPAHS